MEVRRRIVAAFAAGLLVVSAAASGATVRRIVVTTDRSVDCSTLKTIVNDVTKNCETQQEKAVAIYNFMVRTVYMPYDPNLPQEFIRGQLRYANDPVKYINIYGACG